MRITLLIILCLFNTLKLFAQTDSVRYDMVSSNLTFLSIPTSGTFLEIYDMSSYSTPLVVEYGGNLQSSSNNLFNTASSAYSSAGNVPTVYSSGNSTLSSGLYTTKTYNLYTDTLLLRGNFFNRSNAGEYNEYWFTLVPSKNKYYHPIGTEAGGNTPEGFVMGGWPTQWSARDRQSTTLGDNFFTSNNTTPLNYGTWYTATMEITRSGDSMFMSRFEGKDNSNSFKLNKKIYIGKVTSIPYARNTRLGFLADDLLNWVEIVTKKYECKISKNSVPKTCVNSRSIPLFNYFTVEGRIPTDSNAVLKITNISGTGTASLLNKTLAKGIFPKTANVGKYTILITTRCGTQDSLIVEILPNQSKLTNLSDSVFCRNKSKITAGVKILNKLDSITKATWTYPSSLKANDIAIGQDVLLNFSGNIGDNKISVITTTFYGCIDTFYRNVIVLDTPTINFQYVNKCYPEDISISLLSNKSNSYIKSIDWSFSDSSTSTGYSVIKNIKYPGKHFGKIKIIDSMGCQSYGIVNFQSYKKPLVTFTGTADFLTFNRIAIHHQFQKEDSVNYTWQIPNGLIENGETPYIDTIISTKKICYTLIGKSKDNCSDSFKTCYIKGFGIDSIPEWCEGTKSVSIYPYIYIENIIASDSNCTFNLQSTTNNSIQSWKGMQIKNGVIPADFPCGTHQIKLTLKDKRVDSFYISINCKPKLNIVTQDTLFCKNENPTFKGWATVSNMDTNLVSYYWKFSSLNQSNNPSSTFFSSIISSKSDTLLKLLGINKNTNCKDSTITRIHFLDTPTLNNNVNTVCLGEITNGNENNLNNSTQINSWFWEISDGTQFNTRNWSKQMQYAGIYTAKLTATSIFGCTSQSTDLNFEVLPLPTVDFDLSVNSSSNKQFEFELSYTPQPNDIIYWSSDYLGTIRNQNVVRFTTSILGEHCFKLKITNQNGCIDSIIKCQMLESLMYEEILIPIAFTPDNSKLNDEFKPYISHKLDKYKLKIYNKWGELIFYTENQDEGWNGTYMGEFVQEGSYVFILTGRFPSGKATYEKGVVQLLQK